MGIEIESLFTSALGLSAPWRVEKVNLDTAHRRIDFDLTCDAKRLACPACGLSDQGIHDRQMRDWRHLDFFQYEAWLHAPVPRITVSPRLPPPLPVGTDRFISRDQPQAASA